MKTLAELKRVAKAGTLEGKMVIWCGKEVDDSLPDRLKGYRRLVDANSVALFFLNADGKKSELRYRAASLVEFDGETLTIYHAGIRDLNEDEQRIMDEWKAIESTKEFKERSEYDALTDGSSTYWQEKHFFKDRGYLYLMYGQEKERGCRAEYVGDELKIRDDKIKGEVEIKYVLREVA